MCFETLSFILSFIVKLLWHIDSLQTLMYVIFTLILLGSYVSSVIHEVVLGVHGVYTV